MCLFLATGFVFPFFMSPNKILKTLGFNLFSFPGVVVLVSDPLKCACYKGHVEMLPRASACLISSAHVKVCCGMCFFSLVISE